MNDAQQIILEHYHSPTHFGKPQWIPTHTQKLQNLSCGDEIEVYLLVENNIIKDVAFVGEGCSISIAATSILLGDIIGKDIDYVMKYKLEDLVTTLGITLTVSRLKCANLGLEAIKKSLE